MSPHPSPSRRRFLNILGAVILVLGLGTAGFIDFNTKHPDAGAEDTSSLSTTDSRRSSHDMEMFGGKLVALTGKSSEIWASLKTPENAALAIGILSILVSISCFIFADRQPRG